jgi:hypothetical protein
MIDPVTGKELWDFEIIETYRTRRRQTRQNYPFAQNRLRTLTDRCGIRNERARWCQMLNSALEAAGSNKRYDPRSYKDMGLPQKAKKRIDPKVYAKERKGEATEQGIEVARQEWATAIHDLDQQGQRVAAKAVHTRYRNRAFFIALHSAGHVESERFLRLIRKAADLYSLAISAIAAQTATNFVADKMISRARLKKPAHRTKIDKILIEIASEIRATEGKQFGVIADRVVAEYREVASQIAHIRADFARAVQKQLFAQLMDLMAPSNQDPGQKWRKAMSFEEAMAMAAKWFPKHTGLSDPLPKAPEPTKQESAADRYLGKNFFNPKFAGKKIDRAAKPVASAKAPVPKEPLLDRGAVSPCANAQATSASPQRSTRLGHALTQTPPTTTYEQISRSSEAQSRTIPPRPASTPLEARQSGPAMERDLPGENHRAKTSVAPTKVQEPRETISNQKAENVNVKPHEVDKLIERKKRKKVPSVTDFQEDPPDAAAQLEARRRAVFLQRWNARGRGD